MVKKARFSQKASFHPQSPGHDVKSNKIHLAGETMVKHLTRHRYNIDMLVKHSRKMLTGC